MPSFDDAAEAKIDDSDVDKEKSRLPDAFSDPDEDQNALNEMKMSNTIDWGGTDALGDLEEDGRKKNEVGDLQNAAEKRENQEICGEVADEKQEAGEKRKSLLAGEERKRIAANEKRESLVEGEERKNVAPVDRKSSTDILNDGERKLEIPGKDEVSRLGNK